MSKVPDAEEALGDGYDDAVGALRERSHVSDAGWRDLETKAAKRATVATATARLDVVMMALELLRGADSFDDAKAAIAQALAVRWGSNEADRRDLVFRANAQTAYAAGRYRLATDPEVRSLRPFWQFSAVLDSRTSTFCRPNDGMILDASDPFWATHHPPLHFRCRSNVITLTPTQAKRFGGVSKAPADADVLEGFGGPPKLDGWGPNPGDYPPDLRKYVPDA